MARYSLAMILVLGGCFADSENLGGGTGSTGSGGTSDGGGGTTMPAASTAAADDGSSGGAGEGGGTTSTTGADGTTGDGGSSESGVAACAMPIVEDAELRADTGILPDNCNGANHGGGYPYVNIGLGVGLYRFHVSPDVQAALVDDRVESLTLTLHRDFGCVDSGCPAAPGTLEARPLRVDWAEGMLDVQYDGADWCRKDQGQGAVEWGQQGASDPVADRGMQSGTVAMDDMQAQVEIDLDPQLHAADPWLADDTRGALMAIRVAAVDGTFVAATRENTDMGEDPPLLTVTYCPPG